MNDLKEIVKFFNSNLQNVCFTDLLRECKKHNPNLDVEVELENAGYVFNSSKTKIIKKNLNELELVEAPLELDYKKLISFNSDSTLSVRIDTKVNIEFIAFCKEHKELTKNKIVSLALSEFLNNHS